MGNREAYKKEKKERLRVAIVRRLEPGIAMDYFSRSKDAFFKRHEYIKT